MTHTHLLIGGVIIMAQQNPIERAFWMLISALLSGSVYFMGQMASSVANLNDKMATILERVANHELTIKEHTAKIDALELKRN